MIKSTISCCTYGVELIITSRKAVINQLRGRDPDSELNNKKDNIVVGRIAVSNKQAIDI